MNIPKLIKEAHDIAIERGDYDCPVCNGDGEIKDDDSGLWIDCQNCDTSGINPNKNIGELLMLIVSELGKAVEAYKQKRFAMWEMLNHMGYDHVAFIDNFNAFVKDTFEDKIADVFIRLLDLCGYLEIDLSQYKSEKHKIKWHNLDNIGDDIYRLTQILSKVRYYENEEMREYFLFHFFAHLENFCLRCQIPIEKHIKAKMAYNRSSI